MRRSARVGCIRRLMGSLVTIYVHESPQIVFYVFFDLKNFNLHNRTSLDLHSRLLGPASGATAQILISRGLIKLQVLERYRCNNWSGKLVQKGQRQLGQRKA